MNRKVKSFKQTNKQCFCRNNLRCKKLQVQSFVFEINRPTIVLLLVYCPANNTLFEVSPEMCCLGVSNRDATVVMETMQLVLSQFKNCVSYQLRIE